MLLECPNCSTSFKVPTGALGEVGRTVRCSRCAFEWFAEPRDLREPPERDISPAEAAGEEESVEEEFSEDVLSALSEMGDPAEALLERRAQRRKVAPHAAAPSSPPSRMPAVLALVASLLILCAGGLLYFQEPLRAAGLGGLYAVLGMEESHGVKLANLSITKLENVRRTTYMLQGYVVNTTETAQPIPAVRIRLIGADKEILREWEYAQVGTMKPGDILPFSANKLDAAFKDKAQYFQVDIGSGFELALRD